MAKYYIMYWNEIPAQVKAMDEAGEYSAPLPPRFQEVIDEIAMRNGALDSDSYMNAWHWGEVLECPGSPKEVAEKIAHELDTQYPQHTDDLMDYFQNLKKG